MKNSPISRLIERVQSDRKTCKFEHLEALLLACGFERRKGKGSHVVFKRGGATLTVPRRKPVKEIYVKLALELIDYGK
jgi:predicted RNA binding protein YcfA (HicA-like mRNA interferase family)